MLLCLGARFAKQRFCLYLEGTSVLGSLQGVIESFTKGVEPLLWKRKWPLLSMVPASVTLGSVTRGPQGPGRLWFQRLPVRDPSNDPSPSEMGCDVPFPGHQAPTRVGLLTAGHGSGERMQCL